MAALPIEEKADELIQEERAIGEVQLEQLPRATREQRLMRELTAAMVEAVGVTVAEESLVVAEGDRS